jgi:hypothetical protein
LCNEELCKYGGVVVATLEVERILVELGEIPYELLKEE